MSDWVKIDLPSGIAWSTSSKTKVEGRAVLVTDARWVEGGDSVSAGWVVPAGVKPTRVAWVLVDLDPDEL